MHLTKEEEKFQIQFRNTEKADILPFYAGVCMNRVWYDCTPVCNQ